MSQSLSKLYVHLVFSTKDRIDMIPPNELSNVHAYVAEVFNAQHNPAICVGGTTNHIHILFVLNKTTTIADIVRVVKSTTSKWINTQRGMMSRPFCWQEGYGAFSVSNSHVEAVADYIRGQEEHHKQMSFQDEIRRMCQLYHIDLDERYAWI